MEAVNNSPIPITILSGFLGAGKTSVLSHILQSNHEKKIAVLVNDFGKLNIDAALIVAVEGETISLTNGCICCTIRDDLMKEVLCLLSKETPPEHIIIETSGVSDPTLVAHTFLMPALENLVAVENIITVVDADLALDLDEEYKNLAIRQIKIADIVIINKIDLASDQKRKDLQAHIKNIVPTVRTLETIGGRIPIAVVFGSDWNSALRNWDIKPVLPPDFRTWIYSSESPFTFMALRKALEELPSAIFRVKGFIQLEKTPSNPGLLQITGGRSSLRLHHKFKPEQKKTQLVFIGKKSDTDDKAVNALFDHCQILYSRESLEKKKTPIAVKNIRALEVIFG